MEANKLSVWDVVEGSGSEAVAQVNQLGYKLLADNGYPEAADKLTPTMRDAIRKKMSKRGERLHIHGSFDGDKGIYSVFFTLRRGNRRIIATSKAVRLQGVAMDAPVVYDGEEGEV